jgi:hypothetical protein
MAFMPARPTVPGPARAADRRGRIVVVCSVGNIASPTPLVGEGRRRPPAAVLRQGRRREASASAGRRPQSGAEMRGDRGLRPCGPPSQRRSCGRCPARRPFCREGLTHVPIELNHSVIAGLVPAISLRSARPCTAKRDGRDKPGHDAEGGSRSSEQAMACAHILFDTTRSPRASPFRERASGRACDDTSTRFRGNQGEPAP